MGDWFLLQTNNLLSPREFCLVWVFLTSAYMQICIKLCLQHFFTCVYQLQVKPCWPPAGHWSDAEDLLRGVCPYIVYISYIYILNVSCHLLMGRAYCLCCSTRFQKSQPHLGHQFFPWSWSPLRASAFLSLILEQPFKTTPSKTMLTPVQHIITKDIWLCQCDAV